MKHWFFKHYWWLMLVVAFGATAVVLVTSLQPEPQILLGIAGSALSGIYFVQKQKLEEIRLYKDIFAECNKRYDGLNDRLNAIAAKGENEPLSADEVSTLNDYFNLCGEEFLYYRTGYLLPVVWLSWRNGILSFMKSAHLRKHWEQEQTSGSYYGLELVMHEIDNMKFQRIA